MTEVTLTLEQARVRVWALTECLLEHSRHLVRYKSDIAYAAMELMLNDKPCALVIRDSGVETDFTVVEVQASLDVFGDIPEKSEWYLGTVEWSESWPDGRRWYAGNDHYPADPKQYKYKFVPMSGADVLAFFQQQEQPAATESAAGTTMA